MIDQEVLVSTETAPYLEQFFHTHTYSKIFVLCDENSHRHCYPIVDSNIPDHSLYTISAGEEYKTLETCMRIWQEMTRLQLDRKALMINLGGGVVGDMGGFCAASYKRGIEFINIPTTLLAQVDASVGGKLGIDFQGFKNHIGFFKKPKRVFIGTDFLKSLPENEMRSGFAEIIKHALIQDLHHWEALYHQPWENYDWESLVAHSVSIKHRVIEKDPHESGLRKILNFGHTLGHALETQRLNSGNKVLHGEAIAAGMIMELFLSERILNLDPENSRKAQAFIAREMHLPEVLGEVNELIQLAYQDKKNQHQSIEAALVKKLGEAVHNIALSENDIVAAVEYYKEFVKHKKKGS